MLDQEAKKRMKNQTLGYITGAFGLVAGLAWNDAVKSLIEAFIPLSASAVWAKFLYAVIVTIVVVIIGQYLFKLQEEDEVKK